MIARENAQSAGIYRDGFVQAELGGKICDWTRPQNAGVPRSPGVIRLKVFPLAAVSVVDPAMQNESRGAALDARQRDLPEKSYGIVIELPPAQWIEVVEQARGIRVPTPPQISRE